MDAEQAPLFAADPQAYVKPAGEGAVLDNDELRSAAALGADREPNPGAVAAVSTGGGASTVGWTLAMVAMAGLLLVASWIQRRVALIRAR